MNARMTNGGSWQCDMQADLLVAGLAPRGRTSSLPVAALLCEVRAKHKAEYLDHDRGLFIASQINTAS